jgi:hypothetical protein
VTIAVPYGSDIVDNVQLASRADQAELHARGIRLMNMPATSGLEIFQMGEDVLVSAGQNLRVLARFIGGYREIIGYDSLDPPLQAELLNRSENCLVASAKANSDLMSAGLGNLFKRLRDNFLIEWTDPEAHQRLLRTLSSLVELDGVTVEVAGRIACAIIYETYRIGHNAQGPIHSLLSPSRYRRRSRICSDRIRYRSVRLDAALPRRFQDERLPAALRTDRAPCTP